MRGGVACVGTTLVALVAVQAGAAAGLTFSDGTSFSFELIRTARTSARPEADIGSGVVTGDGVGYRLLFDAKQGRFYGYQVKGTRLAKGRFRLEVSGLESEVLERLAKDFEEDGQKLAGESLALDSPPAFDVREGEAVIVALMENPTTGETLSDVIRLAHTKDVPSPDRLHIEKGTVAVNGKMLSSSGGAGGRYVWFALPRQGRFVLSTEVVSGFDFVPAEVIDNRIVRFTVDGNSYEWTSTLPVVQAPPLLKTLWLWHDSEYRLRPNSSFAIGAVDALPAR